NIFLEKIHQFIYKKVGFDILSKENITKVTNFADTFSTDNVEGNSTKERWYKQCQIPADQTD
ncbi:MAG: hypothetical protein EOO19_10890, partial [Chryseobacterium sp.]